MIPYTSEDYRLDFCREQATELRRSGKYERIVVRKKTGEIRDGVLVEFGRIYVKRKEDGNG